MTVDLHFRKMGQGQPLIILHGLFGSSDNWQTIAKKLSENFLVYLVDLRDHGHSPHTSDISYPLMCDDLHQLVINENLHDIILCGHSMGGKTAMFYTQRFSEKTDKLVVVDMGTKKYPPHHQLIFDAIFSINTDVISSRKDAEEILKRKIEDNGVLQFLLKNLYWKEEGKLAWRMNVKLLFDKMDNILAPVPQVAVQNETLFIRGEKSNYITDNDWPGIQELFPHSQLVTVAGSGHWVHAEAPVAFYEALSSFIMH
ncbi:MAG: alpha/beta fold hydrolase [Bacteroidota bacterium]